MRRSGCAGQFEPHCPAAPDLRWLGFVVMMVAGCVGVRDAGTLRDGFGALEQKNFEAALVAADKYLAENPGGAGSADAFYLRGRAVEQRTKYGDAEAVANLREARGMYEKALDAKPSRFLESYIRTSLGNVCYWLNDYAAAEGHWVAAYEMLDAEDLKGWVLYRVGLSLQRQGKWEGADRNFALVQQRYANTEPAARAAAHAGARGFYVQVGAFANATSAEKLVGELRGEGLLASQFVKGDKGLHVVMVGPTRNYEDAVGWRNKLLARFRDAVIVP